MALVAALAGIALMAAACGSSSSATTTSGAPASGGSTTSSGATTSVVVKTASVGGHSALVDAKGFTLYRFSLDKPGKIACLASCITTWPPLLVPAGAHLSMSMSGLGTETRPGGAVQVTFDGDPLYTFSGDGGKRGVATGNGLKGFGGTWGVIQEGQAVKAGASTPAPSSSGSTSTSPGYTSIGSPTTSGSTSTSPGYTSTSTGSSGW